MCRLTASSMVWEGIREGLIDIRHLRTLGCKHMRLHVRKRDTSINSSHRNDSHVRFAARKSQSSPTKPTKWPLTSPTHKSDSSASSHLKLPKLLRSTSEPVMLTCSIQASTQLICSTRSLSKLRGNCIRLIVFSCVIIGGLCACGLGHSGFCIFQRSIF
jgi:hypothetical protein